MHTTRIRAARQIALWAGLLAVLVATPAWAQDSERRKHDPEKHLSRLQEELDLNDQQVEQIRAIFAEQHARFEALREESGDRESKREAFRQLREESHERIQAVLTEDQRARLEELHAEFKERHGHGPGGHGPGDHGGAGHGPGERPDNG